MKILDLFYNIHVVGDYNPPDHAGNEDINAPSTADLCGAEKVNSLYVYIKKK